MDDILKITHNAGFFSCCSVGLHYIIDYVNNNNKNPKVDRSEQYHHYKREENDDLSGLIYTNSIDNIVYNTVIDFNWEKQFSPYKSLDFDSISPFINQYYNPSKLIIDKLEELEKYVNIKYDSIISVCYRGNDKHQETQIAPYDFFIKKAQEVKDENKECVFYLQTDEEDFLKIFIKEFPDTIFNKKIPLIKHNKQSSIQDHLKDHTQEKFNFTCEFLASVLFMSKCKYLITHSGNVGLWIALYRGNFNNCYQYLNGEWI